MYRSVPAAKPWSTATAKICRNWCLGALLCGTFLVNLLELCLVGVILLCTLRYDNNSNGNPHRCDPAHDQHVASEADLPHPWAHHLYPHAKEDGLWLIDGKANYIKELFLSVVRGNKLPSHGLLQPWKVATHHFPSVPVLSPSPQTSWRKKLSGCICRNGNILVHG